MKQKAPKRHWLAICFDWSCWAGGIKFWLGYRASEETPIGQVPGVDLMIGPVQVGYRYLPRSWREE